MHERGARQRLLRRALVAMALGGTLLAGCVGGPAANRAEREPTATADDDDSPGGEDDEDEDDAQGAGPSEQEPEPLPTAEPTGSAEPLDPVSGVNDACCLAAFPNGELLVGTPGGFLSRVTTDGQVIEVGQLQGTMAESTSELLALAIQPDGDSDTVYAYYMGSSSSAVASYSYEATEDGARLGTPGQIVSGLPRADSRQGGVLAFGPEDGLLYVGVGDGGDAQLAADPESLAGKILRMERDGKAPAAGGNIAPDSLVYSSGHGDIRGLAWDEAQRLWSVEVDPDGVTEVNAVIPGTSYDEEAPKHSWALNEIDPVGLAYGAVSLWVPSQGQGVWRLPLDLAAAEASDAPELLAEELTAPTAVLPDARDNQLRVLTADVVQPYGIT